jgi:DNA ligase-1
MKYRLNMKKFPVLYKYTSKGQVQQWQIVVDGDSFYTEEGIQGGKLTVSLPTYCIGKNVGKKNETTRAEQAEKEAAAKHKKKVDSGYNEVLTDEKNFFEPMLAEKYEDRKDLVFTVRTFIQPKLDGLRADNEGGKLVSRNGKAFVTCPHLYQDKVRLDGELYNHLFKDDFNKIVSLCRKTKPTKEDLEDSSNMVEFWAYDMPEFNAVFSKRYKALTAWVKTNPNKKIKIVPTFEVFSQEDIDRYHEIFIEQGYEGSIIRLDLGPYENKRSKQLLKYKDFVDSEFVIIGYEEGEGGRAGTIGKFIMQHDTKDGVTFKSNVKGNFDYLKQVWKERESYIGKTATVKHFKRTPDDIPRFPYVVKIAREDYE